MSGSLADQLLKAGLVNEDDVKRARSKPKRPANKGKGKHKKGKTATKPAGKAGEIANKEATKALSTAERVSQQSAEKKAQQAHTEQRRLMNLRIAEILKEQPVQDPAGEVRFSYVYQDKVRNIYLSEEQRQQLLKRELAITVIKAKTKLIPATLVEQILAIDPERFVHLVEDEQTDENDPYAEFKVPDDLTW